MSANFPSAMKLVPLLAACGQLGGAGVPRLPQYGFPLSSESVFAANMVALGSSRMPGEYPDSAALMAANREAEYVSNTQPEKNDLEQIFHGLAKNWRDATGGYSLNMRRYAHPTYHALMHALGKESVTDVVPFVLRELKERPDMWFEALKVLTNQNPAKDSKTFDEAVAAWIAWGKQNKYI
jgi:hypothetical protein